MRRYYDKSDSDLVAMTLLGNSSAYEELVVRHECAVKGTAYKVTNNTYSAEDASQDAFVSAWMRLNTLREYHKFGAWVCAIAKNHARRLVTYYRCATPDISLHLLENLDLNGSGEDELLGRLSVARHAEQERDERLHEAIKALGVKIRETVTLHYFDGLSVKEIALKLSIPEGTVKWRLCEGRKQLRKEYGFVETTYNENEALVRRVMRQVERLKLWRLKTDKSGFEAEYRAVLAAVEALDESQEKSHALADVLLRGCWWIPGEENDAVLARIKKNAVKGRNEGALEAIFWEERDAYKGEERLRFIRDIQIPYCQEHDFREVLGATWFWLGYEYFINDRHDEMFPAFQKVLDVLTPADTYYVCALAALQVLDIMQHAPPINETNRALCASAEQIKWIDGKPYQWAQPGFSFSSEPLFAHSLFWNTAHCDCLLFDPSLSVGECVVGSDSETTLTFVADDITVTTPAGTFEHCAVWRCEERYQHGYYTETVWCPNVGLVRQIAEGYEGLHTWELTSYAVHGGEGLFPVACGNVWEYGTPSANDTYEVINRFRVVHTEDSSATLSGVCFVHFIGYNEESWQSNITQIRREFTRRNVDDPKDSLCDEIAPKALERAKALAVTPREKRITAVMGDVLGRLFATDPACNPAYTHIGRWNFYDQQTIHQIGDTIRLGAFGEHIEWKRTGDLNEEGCKILYNFLYDILYEAAGALWDENWKSGYEHSRKKAHATVHLRVQEEEAVTVKAGTFEHCRPVMIDCLPTDGTRTYRHGKKTYWFAPHIGIVKMVAYHDNGTPYSTWELTDYTGTADGYFPLADGLFRRYAPTSLGDGYHASVEYTVDIEGDNLLLLRNALGTQDRDMYEKKE